MSSVSAVEDYLFVEGERRLQLCRSLLLFERHSAIVTPTLLATATRLSVFYEVQDTSLD